ncbi:hypothetical protein FCH28_01670 [Streptomyces piniterrae]|uniref:DUF3040 domain-containing protein n=1 Tax=Streptomyces piniterrae TaxID=2571125 RepID=A0A4U0NVX9_9ACTN|nr:hypothetical protein [Streptomyces piniterrae]TJZ58891.1 hypothetical protein FCH28_01670 [Streptomyces piniterrae]
MSPDDDCQLGDLAENFRHDAAPDPNAGTDGPRRTRRALVDRPGTAWLALAAAIGGLATGIALAHGLLIAGALMLAGLSGQYFDPGPAQRRTGRSAE